MTGALWLLIKTVGSLLASTFMLRALAHRLHLSPYNPVSQFLQAVTDWMVQPLRKLIAPSRNMDWASVLAAFIVALVVAVIGTLLVLGSRVPMAGMVLLTAIVWLVQWSLNALIVILILQALISWVNPHAPMAPALNQLTEPFLAPVRKFIPPLGGVDLSPMVLILLIYVGLELLNGVFFQIAPRLAG